MAKELTFVILVILELAGVFGLYLTQAKNESTVYELKEDKTTQSLTITNPQFETPTLREIVYYHIVEKPYEHKNAIKDDQHTINDDSITDNEPNLADSNRIDENKDITNNDDNVTEAYDYTIGNESTSNKYIVDSETTVNHNEHDTVDGENMIRSEYRTDNEHVTDKYNNMINKEEELEFNDSGRSFTNSQGYQFFGTDPENQEKSADLDDNNLLLDVDDDNVVHFHFKPNSTVHDKNKDQIPKEKPGDSAKVDDKGVNNFDSKPQYVNPSTNEENNVDKEKPGNLMKPNGDETSTNSEDSAVSADLDEDPVPAIDIKRFKRDIEPSQTIEDKETDPLSEEENLLIEKLNDVISETHERKERSVTKEGKSYGMSLTGDTGVVWNELNDKKFSFLVGAINNKDEDIKYDADDNEETNDNFDKSENDAKEATLQEETNKESSTEASTDKLNTERPSLELKKTGNIYGMSLTGEQGTVWNNLNGRRVSYDVGQQTREKKEIKNTPLSKTVTDDEEINAQIDKFEKDLKASSKEETSHKVTTTKKPKIRKPKIKKSTKKLAIKNPTTEKTIVEETSTAKPSVKIQKKNKLSKPAKTYGMSLKENHGTVWNDLNGRRVSYHVGESVGENKGSNGADNSVLKTNDDKEINEQIKEFEKDIDTFPKKPELSTVKPTTLKPATDKTINKKPKVEKPFTNKPSTEKSVTEKLITEKPITQKPIIEKPMTEKSVTEEPITEKPIVEVSGKPAKTYGMSLNGDHGIVWNDLNGHRVSYHVGEENEENTTAPEASITTENPDLNEIINNIIKPLDDNKDDNSKPDSFLDEAYKELDKIFGTTEKNKPQNVDNATVNEIIDVIKEVFKNETVTLEDKFINCSNSKVHDEGENKIQDEDNKKGNSAENTNGNELDGSKGNGNDSNEGDKDKTSQLPEEIQNIMKNEEFWKWLNEWSSAYVELLMNKIDTHIKEEVAKQIEEFYATHEHDDTAPVTNYATDCKENFEDVEGFKDVNTETPTKKRKDKDSEDKNGKKQAPIKIQASNVYGNSVGNGNVTNIFVFNIRNMSDLDNVTQLYNGTNGVYVFGSEDTKPVGDNINVELQGENDKANEQTTPNPNDSSSNIPNDRESINTTEKATPESTTIKEQPDQITETPTDEVESTTKLPENNYDGVTTEKSNESSSNTDNDHEIKDTTEIAVSEPVIIEEQLDPSTADPIEKVEPTTKLPEKEDEKEKDNIENNENNNDDGVTTEKSSESSSTVSDDHDIKDTTTEKTPTTPSISEENTTTQATETPKETIESTTTILENKNSEEKDENKSDENKFSTENPTTENTHLSSFGISEDNDVDTTTEKVTTTPVAIEEQPNTTTETPIENLEITTKAQEQDSNESKERTDDDKSKIHEDTASPDSKEDEDTESNKSTEPEDDNSEDETSSDKTGSAEDTNSTEEEDARKLEETDNTDKPDVSVSFEEKLDINDTESKESGEDKEKSVEEEPNNSVEDADNSENSNETNESEED